MKTKMTYKLISSLVVATALTAASAGFSKVYAEDCESTYGGGQTCIRNKSFQIDKKVRVEGDSKWEDKVTDVKKSDTVEFRIKIKNVGEVETDNMKMEDELPDEMERTGGSGLTEYWDNFEPGDTKEFIIKAKVDASEYDRKNFEKCIVNKAELRYGNKFEGADTATVCYSDSKPKELPKTGAESTALFAVLGLVTTASGLVMKKFAR